MPVGSETVCDSGIITPGKVSTVKKGKRQLSELKKENTEDTPLAPELAYQLAVRTIPHRAEKLYRAKVLLNWCAAALLLVSALWSAVPLWGSPYSYAGAVFHWIWMSEYHYYIEIIHWAVSAFFLIPALVIMWKKKCFWRTFLRLYALLAIIACCAAAEDVEFSYWSRIVSPGKILWAIGVIFAGIFYASRNRELWGADTCTLSQLKLLAAHYQNLATVTQAKFWQRGKQSFRKRWFSVTMVLFYCVCTVWVYSGYRIIKNSCYWQTSSGSVLYEGAEKYLHNNTVCNTRRFLLLRKSAEKDDWLAMLDLSHEYLWSWVDENVEMNPNYDWEKGIYWIRRAIAISTPSTGELVEWYLNNSFFGTEFTGERAAVLEKLKAELAEHMKNMQKNQSGN